MRVSAPDDDPEQAEHLRPLLESSDRVAPRYRRGLPLLADLARASDDLIIIDWEISNICGYDVLHTARDRPPATEY